MAAYSKYNAFVTNLTNKLIDAFGTTDTWKAVIHSDAPAPTTDSTLANLSEIPGTNGYTTGGTSIGFNSDDTTTPGTITATASDVTWTASGGSLGGVTNGRYFSIYDDTPTTPVADPLLCYFDYSATFTVASGETMTLDFGTTLWTLV